MIKAIKNLLGRVSELAEDNRKREDDRLKMLRENNEAWVELNRDFVDNLNLETDREIDCLTDTSIVRDPDAYTFDGSPLKH